MTPDEEQAAILCKVLMGLFPNAPFSVDILAARILEALGSVGWSLSYDPEYTRQKIQEVLAVDMGPAPEPFVPPRPPERFA